MKAEDGPSCPACGAALTEDAPEGLCAKCVVEVMLNFAEADDGTGSEEPQADEGLGQIGDYQILERIAAGGMGVVYKARQLSMGRMVALKLIAEGKLASHTEKERFLLEARAAGELDHPHILPIFEVGEDSGQYYFSMRLITGGSLTDRLPEIGPQQDVRSSSSTIMSGFRDRQTAMVKLLVKIARAVHHAHEQGILHRDLKPANILIDQHGEPQITDFGLAKRVHEDTHLTISGQILGSPAYMAPEQAEGRNRDLTNAVDIYPIGVMLYQFLTGVLPFDGETPMELIQKTLTKEPRPPRKLNPRIDQDLETICLRCLEKSPTDRYPSADSLADDLENWLAGRPINAKPISTTRRMVKWVKRKPAIAALVAVALTATLAIGLLQVRHERKQQANLNADYIDGIQLAAERIEAGQRNAARRTLESLPEDLRGFEWHWYQREAQGLDVGYEFEQAIHQLLPAPDDPSHLLIQLADGDLYCWDRTQGGPRLEGAYPPVSSKVTYDGGGAFLFTRTDQGVELVLTGENERRGGLTKWIKPPDDGFVAARPGKKPDVFVTTRGRAGDPVYLWQPGARDGRVSDTLTEDLLALTISQYIVPKERRTPRTYVAFAFRTKLEIWRLEEDVFFRETTILKGPGEVTAMAFSPNGRHVFTGDPLGKISVWNRRGKTREAILEHPGKIVALACPTLPGANEEYEIAAANAEGTVRILEFPPVTPWVVRQQILAPIGFNTGSDVAAAVRLSEGGAIPGLLTMSPVVLTGFGEHQEYQVLASGLLNDRTLAMVTNPEDKSSWQLYHATEADGIQSVGELEQSKDLPPPTQSYCRGDEWRTVIGSRLITWDLVTGKQRSEGTLPPTAQGKKVCIFGHSRPLLMVMGAAETDIFDLTTSERTSVRLDTTSPLTMGVVSPDGRTIAGAGEDGELHLWQASTGVRLASLRNHPWQNLTFSPDGFTLFARAKNGDLHCWQTHMPTN